MKVSTLISQLARGVWAIEPTVAQSFIPIINSVIQGNQVSFDYKGKLVQGEVPVASVYTFNNVVGVESNRPEGFKAVSERSVAIIPISGPIMKYDYCGDAGTSTMAMAIKQASSNPNITAIVLRIDSPGGMLSGTATLADAIKSANKPTIALVDDGLMASAAYWIGSAADYIFSTHLNNAVGSIGGFTQIADFTGAYEKEGVKIKTIYSSLSSEKNGEYRAALEDDNDEPMIQRLDAMVNQFIQTVKSNRPTIKASKQFDPFKGGAPNSQVALDHGLIDGFKSFDETILFAAEMAEKQENNFKVKIA